MSFFKKTSTVRDGGLAAQAQIDQLRSRLESEVAPSSMIVLTSATGDDGAEYLAQGLAHSFASIGYSTLYIDTKVAEAKVAPPGLASLTLDEIAAVVVPDERGTDARILTLADQRLQSSTSKREIASSFEILCAKFDYIIVSVDGASRSAFAGSLISAAGAVLACVKSGRRERREDGMLAADLDMLGARFLGVVAVDRSVSADVADRKALQTVAVQRKVIQIATSEKEAKLREAVGYQA